MKPPVFSSNKMSFALRRLASAFMVTLVLVSLVMISLLVTHATAAKAATSPVIQSPVTQSPVTLSLQIFKEQRTAASDGTTQVVLAPLNGAVPGDRLVYRLTYTNTGTQPVNDVVLDYPMPQDIAYRAAAEGSLAPELTRDGDSVTALRWHVPGQIAPGAHGEVSFKATLN